jgi:sporulation protein YlmC with PRC-barrel domain
MRLSDLLHSRVTDVDGVDLGGVRDVLVDRDAGFVIEGLVVGGYYATRLGFERGAAQGPWPISALFRRLERRARFVPWAAVRTCDRDGVRLSVPSRELSSPPPI